MRLVVFGDSFVSHEFKFREDDDSPQLWTERLAHKLNLPLVVHALGGTNLNWSLLNFMKYLKSDYREDDIIIFIVTNGSRLPYVHEDFPPKNSMIGHFAVQFGNKDRVTDELGTGIVAWAKYYNVEIHHAHTMLLRQTLQSLPNSKLLLSAFPDSMSHNLPLACDFHVGGTPLMGIGQAEIADANGKFVPIPGSMRGRQDPRPNHLCEENHEILATDLYKILMKEKPAVLDGNDYRRYGDA
jgi:hypothetical protein